ncbi:hypothetical protein ES703_00043 [subsurface metagenome]
MVEFRDIEVYFLDLSETHQGRQVTPGWNKISEVEVLETNCEFRLEVMRGPGGRQWLALYNDACNGGTAKVVVKGHKEVEEEMR